MIDRWHDLSTMMIILELHDSLAEIHEIVLHVSLQYSNDCVLKQKTDFVGCDLQH